jgi:hypothetical protein
MSGNGKNEILFKGLWYDEKMERIWFIKDSLILFHPFYPYSKWEIKQDTLKILDLESLHLDSPQWIKYSFELLTENKALLKTHQGDVESFSFQRITNVEYANNLPNRISLEVSDYSFDENVVDLKIEINIANSIIRIFKLNEPEKDINCVLESLDLLPLKYLISNVHWEELETNFISNEMHLTHFKLSVEFEDSVKNKTVLSDSGGAAPSSINNLITFLWSTSQLKCNPDDYIKELYNP